MRAWPRPPGGSRAGRSAGRCRRPYWRTCACTSVKLRRARPRARPRRPSGLKVRVRALVQRHEMAADAGAWRSCRPAVWSTWRAGSRRRTPALGAAARPAGPPAIGAGGAGRFSPACRRKRGQARRQRFPATTPSAATAAAPVRIGLAADLRPLVRRQVDTARRGSGFRRSCASPRPPARQRLPRANSRSPSVSSGQVMPDLVDRELRVIGRGPSRRSACIVSSMRLADGDHADRRRPAPPLISRSIRLARAQASTAGIRSSIIRRSSSARSAGKCRVGSKFSPCGGSAMSGVTNARGRRDDRRSRPAPSSRRWSSCATQTPAEARHRPAGQAEIDDVLHRGRVQHRDEAVLENRIRSGAG